MQTGASVGQARVRTPQRTALWPLCRTCARAGSGLSWGEQQSPRANTFFTGTSDAWPADGCSCVDVTTCGHKWRFESSVCRATCAYQQMGGADQGRTHVRWASWPVAQVLVIILPLPMLRLLHQHPHELVHCDATCDSRKARVTQEVTGSATWIAAQTDSAGSGTPLEVLANGSDVVNSVGPTPVLQTHIPKCNTYTRGSLRVNRRTRDICIPSCQTKDFLPLSYKPGFNLSGFGEL